MAAHQSYKLKKIYIIELYKKNYIIQIIKSSFDIMCFYQILFPKNTVIEM